MGADKTPDYLRGLLIPDPRFTFAGAFSETGSTYTENTARPGVPVALDNSDLIVETSGTTAGSSLFTVYTQNSGYPEDLGGTFLYQDTGSSLTYRYYGWEPPHTITGLERVQSGSNSTHYLNFDTVTAQDDALIIAGAEESSGILKVWHKAAKAITWTEVSPPSFLEPGMWWVAGNRPTDATGGAEVDVGSEPGPALVLLPSGRGRWLYWIQTAAEPPAPAAPPRGAPAS